MGPAAEFGALPLSGHEPTGTATSGIRPARCSPDELAAARDRFAGWPSWVHDLLAVTLADQLIRNDVYHLPHGPASYSVAAWS